MNIAALPPLRAVLEQAALAADKRFGQHFLFDLNICRKIARVAGPLDGTTVVEVGPGPGGLTRALLEAGARVVAVEKDARFTPILQDLAGACEGRLKFVCADALEVDEGALIAPATAASIVANLPYNIATPLLVKWLTGGFRPQRMTLMFQKEVAQRIIAAPGDGDYGRLAVLTQAVCEAQILINLPPRAFTPPPKVASAVVALRRRARVPSDEAIDLLQAVTMAAFGQRRKMLRSALRTLGGESLCEGADVDPNARAETLDVAAFLRLAAVVGATASSA
jgi:16S rRNA (adenine1518-N6/adenine1519-N6)-dimethyltransferase